MQVTVEVASRYQGPPQSGNGGYVSGLLARYLSAQQAAQGVEVTLRAPTPLDVPIEVKVEPARTAAYVGDVLIGEALPLDLELQVPKPPAFAQTLAAQPHSPALDPTIQSVVPGGTGFHPVCFCCGADVAVGQGLRVFAAAVSGFDGVAAAWCPDSAFADATGMLPTEVIWAALDCPGQFAFLNKGIRTGLLGRMTARLLQPVAANEQCVITGWCLHIEGKKHFAGTALFNQRGECCAYSKQVWIGRR